MKNYTVSEDLIYQVKIAINKLFENPSIIDDMSNIVLQSFTNYFGNYSIDKDIKYDDRIIRIKIDNIFLNQENQIRVDAQLYNFTLQNINRAHTDAINVFLNKYKDEIYKIIHGRCREHMMFYEIIPVIASQICMIWGHPTLDKSGIITNIRLY